MVSLGIPDVLKMSTAWIMVTVAWSFTARSTAEKQRCDGPRQLPVNGSIYGLTMVLDKIILDATITGTGTNTSIATYTLPVLHTNYNE